MVSYMHGRGLVLPEIVLRNFTMFVAILIVSIAAFSIFEYVQRSSLLESYDYIARTVFSSIDQLSSVTGDSYVAIDLPSSLEYSLTVSEKEVKCGSDGNEISINFPAKIHISEPVKIENSKKICIVKTSNDERIHVFPGDCGKCVIGDGICDPICGTEFFELCDPDCYGNVSDNVCNPLCAEDNDNICDPDCHRNEEDLVCDLDCKPKDINNDGFEDAPGDGICDPDCNDVSDGICDLDCLVKGNFTRVVEITVCDPDCKPVDANSDGTEDSKDGICYVGCYNYTAKRGENVTIFLKSDGICDLDCNETNGICDPDCNMDKDCEKICAKEGESCENVPCCEGLVCCPGDKICRPASLKRPCCGNGYCEVSYYMLERYPEVRSYLEDSTMQETYKFSVWNDSAPPTYWENFLTCPSDCKLDAWPGDQSHPYGQYVDGYCDAEVSLSLDPDCCEEPLSVITDGGHKGLGCIGGGHTLKRDYIYCDPDVAWGSNAPRPCPLNRAGQSNRTQCRGDGICAPVRDGCCDPDCADPDASLNYTLCDPDCCGGEMNIVGGTCAKSPGCVCEIRVKKGNWTAGICYYDTDQPLNDHKPHWDKAHKSIDVCGEAVIEYLNIMGWDIKQIEIDILKGWFFDYSRYDTIRRRNFGCREPPGPYCYVQPASMTIMANIGLPIKQRITEDSGSCCGTDLEFCGVGFCGDHATALVSILRTLGVPPSHVFAAMSSWNNGQSRHAYVVYYCNNSLPENLKLRSCEGHWGEWLILDITAGDIYPLKGSNLCNHTCIWWNDYGPYPLINRTKYGFGGMIDATQGYAFDPATGCKHDNSCLWRKLCGSELGITCVE